MYTNCISLESLSPRGEGCSYKHSWTSSGGQTGGVAGQNLANVIKEHCSASVSVDGPLFVSP